jgi:hypothetical protein
MDETRGLTVENLDGLKQWCRTMEGVLLGVVSLVELVRMLVSDNHSGAPHDVRIETRSLATSGVSVNIIF